MPAPKYNRILLKLSGESFKGDGGFGIDPQAVNYMAGQVKHVAGLGVEVGLVVGGGNIWRGVEGEEGGMDRATADYAGMLATVINALALQDSLERVYALQTRVQSAITMPQITEPYIRRRAIRHLEKGRVVVFAAGTGNPFMTTDTAAALRAVEIDSSVLLMAKHNVDGVYASDPNKNPYAKRLDFLTFQDALGKRLQVIDSTALAMCMENDLPIVVFDMQAPGNLERIVAGEMIGSVVASSTPQ